MARADSQDTTNLSTAVASDPVFEAAIRAGNLAAAALIDTAPTTQAGLRALQSHLLDDRYAHARGFIRVPPGRDFMFSLDSTRNHKNVDFLIAKRAAEIDNAA
jgi:hypothetical protein